MPGVLNMSISGPTKFNLLLIVGVAISNTITLAADGLWLRAAFFGAAVPIFGLLDWLALRRREPESAQAAEAVDRMLMPFLFALVGLAMASG